ncbi:MAG: DNA alkylation repair protein, partial [Planctomycetes bacterium]|nr:DNA alkylation repair protein [Planctomycetota bacterium]
RAVGVEILARRAELLEPPDLPFVEGLLKEAHDEAVRAHLARDVLGPLVCKNKKLWKDLNKLAKSADERLRLAAVQAAKAPCASDGSVFDRFEKLVTPLLAKADEHVQSAVDEVLRAAAEHDADAVKAFADAHGLEFEA